MEIRAARPDELELVEGLLVEASEWLASRGFDQWQFPPHRDRIEHALKHGEGFLLVEDGQPLGTITVDEHADPEFWRDTDQTFFLAQSHDEKIDLLGVIESHLKPEGAAFLDCTDPAEYLRAGGDATSVTYPLGRDRMVTITQTADRASQATMSIFLVQGASTLTAFHETATWATLPEIRLMARMAGLEVASVNGSYAGEEYNSRSREMLVVLERK